MALPLYKSDGQDDQENDDQEDVKKSGEDSNQWWYSRFKTEN